MKRNVAWLVVSGAAVWIAVSCAEPEPEQAAVPDTSPVAAGTGAVAPAIRAQLDSANAAFSAEDYQRALSYYRNVVRIDTALSAGWFGVYMAESKLGNQAAADSAIARARKEGSN